jgi:hypothetical protein
MMSIKEFEIKIYKHFIAKYKLIKFQSAYYNYFENFTGDVYSGYINDVNIAIYVGKYNCVVAGTRKDGSATGTMSLHKFLKFLGYSR